jgi:hypothetical protein
MLFAHQLNRAVIVAVAGVRVMQVAIDQIIRMLAVRHWLVTAVCAVGVVLRVSVARVSRRATFGVRGVDGQPVFVRVGAVRRMQVAIVEIVSVAFVNDGDVATGRPVHVRFSVLRVVCAGYGQSDRCNCGDDHPFHSGSFNFVFRWLSLARKPAFGAILAFASHLQIRPLRAGSESYLIAAA